MRYTTTDGKVWYLHCKEISWGRGKTTRINYYFSKTQKENICNLPIGYKVFQSRVGMPMLKKI